VPDGRIRTIRIGGRDLVASYDRVAVGVVVVREKVASVRVVGMEGDAEQPALPATADASAQVQKRLGQDLTILGDADTPRLLDDEEAAAAIARIDYLNGLIEAIGHELEAEVKDA
jgi:hypothetical protein